MRAQDDEPGRGLPALTSAVLEMGGVQWATQKAVVEAVLGRRPGVAAVHANAVFQTGHDPLEDGDPDGCSPYGCRSRLAA